MRIKFEIRNVSEVAGVVNDLSLSRVQDLSVKALQSLVSLFRLAPSFLASPLANRVIRIALHYPKENEQLLAVDLRPNKSVNVTRTPQIPPADIIVVSKSFDRSLDITPLFYESAHMEAAAEPVELLSTHPEGRLSSL